VKHAKEAVAIEPFRETSYQLLMRAHAAVGNRAEALRVYERCRSLLSEELGVSPSPQTEAVYLEILRS
jgi:SARP family transcriptional regulator, regulator of embCAB operon